MIAKFFNLIGQLVMWSLVILLSGVLYVGGYFYVKSGEPMTVAEAQKRAPGLTFRDFWGSRVEQWRADDVKFAEVKDRQGPCEPVSVGITAWRTVIAIPFVVQSRLVGQGSDEYYNQAKIRNNGAIPSMELLYNGPLLDAAWATFEEGSWWQYANSAGSPTKIIPGDRICKTTYPTPADVSANRDAAGALP